MEVSGFILGKFSLPEAPVIRRHVGVFGTVMPEAAVHKDGDSRPPKNEVRFAKYGLVAPPTGDMVAAQ